FTTGDRYCLCGGGGDEVADHRVDHPADGFAVCAAGDPASLCDAAVPGADDGDLQHVRVHHRDLGGQLGEAADHSLADRYSADLPGWQFLFDPHAAGVLADGDAVQSGRLSGERIPVELL